MKKRLLIFGLILCLMLVSGWTGRNLSFYSLDTGDFYYQSEPWTGCIGMTGVPTSDKAVLLSVSETCFGRETEQKLVPEVPYACFSFDRVLCIKKYEVTVPELWNNDQLNLIAMTPRA